MTSIVTPHDKVSRLVTEADLPRVFRESEEIYKLLNTQIGIHNRFYAIAHPQIDDQDPLRFFVVNNQMFEFHNWPSIVIVNPVILRHTGSFINSEEGCASFSLLPSTIVDRWNKCEVEFSPLEFDENQKPRLGKRVVRNCHAKVAKVFQHEIDHLDAKYIYKI